MKTKSNMDCKELMIGDLVVKPSGNILPMSGAEFGNDECWFEDINPIPFTFEILKKNGFKQVDLTIGNYALRLDEEGVFHISTILWGGVFDGRVEIEVLKEYTHVQKKYRYVHELQQALRLCGLNDLADNLKVE